MHAMRGGPFTNDESLGEIKDMERMKRFVLAASALTLMGIAGCSRGEGNAVAVDTQKEFTDPVPIIWYLCANHEQPDIGSVEAAADAYLQEQYGLSVELNLKISDYAGYSDKMQMVIASEKPYDICFTSSWNNNFNGNAARGAYYPLDQLLKDYGKDVWASMPEKFWEAGKFQGTVYGVPSQQVFFKRNYVTVVAEYAREYGLDTDKIKGLEDLKDFFYQVKADHPQIYPLALSENGINGKNLLSMGFENITGEYLPGVIRITDQSATVVNQYETPEMEELYQLIYQFRMDGIIKPDAALTTNNGVAGMKDGTHIASVNATLKPGSESTEKENFGGREVLLIPISEPWITTESLTSGMNAVSSNSKYPELAMQILNLVNTDEKLYNLLCFGIEGKHYQKNGDGTIKSIEGAGYDPGSDWAFGNQFLAWKREGQAPDIWEKTIEENKSARTSPAMGFVFDPMPVQKQIAGVNTILDKYRIPLETGLKDPKEELTQFREELKKAGSDEIIAEAERQLRLYCGINSK